LHTFQRLITIQNMRHHIQWC